MQKRHSKMSEKSNRKKSNNKREGEIQGKKPVQYFAMFL